MVEEVAGSIQEFKASPQLVNWLLKALDLQKITEIIWKINIAKKIIIENSR